MLVEPDPLTSRTARQRIGGRWSLSWQTYLITGVLGVLALLAGEAQTAIGNFPALTWLMLAVLGMLAVGVVLLFFNFTLFRNRRVQPLPIWLVVLADGFLGVVFTIVPSVGASLLDIATTSNLTEKLILNALTAMWWGPTLSYFMDLRQQWATERDELVADHIQVELTSMAQGELIGLLQEELNAKVVDELSSARSHVATLRRDFAPTTADWQEAANVLRGTAEHAVRPLSRELLESSKLQYPRMRWWTLLANVVRHQPFNLFGLAVIDILGTFSAQIRTFGWLHGMTLLFGGLAWSLILMWIGNALMRRFPRHHATIFISTLIALQSTVLLRGVLRETWLPGSASLPWAMTQVIAGVAVVFATSGFGAWWSQRIELRATLREEINADRVRAMARSQHVAELARETSQVLHGTVQTRLVSCAMAIEQASASGDTELLNTALNEAIIVLEQPSGETPGARTLQEEVARKLELWDGLCEITCTIEPDTHDVNAHSALTIGRVVEEGISNAIRHGKATSITITITRVDDSCLRLAVIDNGLGPQHGSASIGTAFIQQASENHWSLTATQSGTLLEVFISA